MKRGLEQDIISPSNSKSTQINQDIFDDIIMKEHIYEKILESCPSFKIVLDSLDKDELNLPYVIAGYFSRHLMCLYNDKKREEFAGVAHMIEQFTIVGDEYVKNYATIAILEGIQNSWVHGNTDPELFAIYLKPESKKNWSSLNKYWKEIMKNNQDELKKKYRKLEIDSYGYFGYLLRKVKNYFPRKN